MTDDSRGFGGISGAPWSVDVLADLHSGVLDAQDAAELWRRVNADPEAREIIDALDATTADLSGLSSEPVEPIPADVAARIDAALAQERQGRSSNVVSIDAARKRRNRRAGWGAGFLAAAAAVVAAVVVAVPGGTNDTTSDLAQPPHSPAPSGSAALLSLNSGDLGSAFADINGVRNFGALGNEQRLNACIEASGLDTNVRPVGIRPATIDGQDAVLVLYTTGQLAQFRLVALSPDCGPDSPGLLMDKTIGRQGG